MQKLFYACNIHKLDPELRQAFFASEKSKQAKKFSEQKTTWHQVKFMIFVLMNVIGMSHYNIMGILGYQTFLLEENFIKKYIIKRRKYKTLLDIGAGNGCITDVFQKIIPDITCLEPSSFFRKILRKK